MFTVCVCLPLFFHLVFSYRIVNIPKSWDNAQSFCQSHCNSHLAIFHSSSDFDAIVNLSTNLQWDLGWIGLKNTNTELHDINTFQWIDNTSLDNIFPWDTDNPNWTDDCVEIRVNHPNVTMADTHCEKTKSFICNDCIFDDVTVLPTYYVSTNRFELPNTQIYCNDHCHSELGSIHSDNEQEIAMYLASMQPTLHEFDGNSENSHNVLIGLYMNQSIFHWMDKSRVNYGNISDVYPWKTGDPDLMDDNCVAMRADNGYQWGDALYTTCSSGHPQRFMCNSCDGEINKYAVVHAIKNSYADAEIYCNTWLGTSLASIHSKYDYDLAKMLCNLANMEVKDTGCFIGLNKIENNNTFRWNDGTEVDYGHESNDIWSDTIDIDMDCVEMAADYDYTLQTKECSVAGYFMCNIPSVLCSESDWLTLIGNHSFNACGMYSDVQYMDNIVISKKQWMNNQYIYIEYIFKFISSDNGSSGIILFKGSCDYYYFALNPATNRVYVYENRKGIEYVLDEVDITELGLYLIQDIYYVLKIEIFYAETVTMSLNNVYVLWQLQIGFDDSVNSGYIGIRNMKSTIHSKSLYVSGASFDLTDPYPFLCTKSPTMEPTTEPTIEPSFEPTDDPTVQPTVRVLTSTDDTTTNIISSAVTSTTRQLSTDNSTNILLYTYDTTVSSTNEANDDFDYTNNDTSNDTSTFMLYWGSGLVGVCLCCVCIPLMYKMCKHKHFRTKYKDSKPVVVDVQVKNEDLELMNMEQVKGESMIGSPQKMLSVIMDHDEEKDDDDSHPSVEHMYNNVNGNDGNQFTLRFWLQSVVRLPEYYDSFVGNGYETIEFVMDITSKQQLEDIGIKKVGHQVRIFAKIQDLKTYGIEQYRKSTTTHA